jgi:hypothetical protein
MGFPKNRWATQETNQGSHLAGQEDDSPVPERPARRRPVSSHTPQCQPTPADGGGKEGEGGGRVGGAYRRETDGGVADAVREELVGEDLRLHAVTSRRLDVASRRRLFSSRAVSCLTRLRLPCIAEVAG